MFNKKIKNIIIFLGLVMAAFGAAHFTYALDPGLDHAQGTGLSTEDPKIIIANIIRVILGFLGIVAVSLIIYAGWMWMTAAGNYEKVEKAKKILTGAVIGLVIVLSAFAIATFVINKLMDATGAGPGGNGGGGGGGVTITNNSSFYMSGTIPPNNKTDVVRNVVIKAFFNKQMQTLNQAGLDNNFRVEKIANIDANTGTETAVAPALVAGVASGASNWHEIDFRANAGCGDERNTPNCLASWSRFRVTVNGGNGIIAFNQAPVGVAGNGMAGMAPPMQNLSCTGSTCQFEFATGNSIDTSGPTAGIVPDQICKDDGTLKAGANTIGGWGRDDVGISGLNFFERRQGGAENLVKVTPGDGNPYFYSEWQYATGAMNIGDTYDFRVEASDMTASSSSASFTTTIKPGHCCNGVLDGGETEIDCGGPDCISCSELKPVITNVSPQGGFCANNPNTACASNADCAGSTCNATKPNGAVGNFVTISGKYFGATAGKVFFTGANGWIEARLASDAATGNAACTDAWSSSQIIAVVPAGAAAGPIKIETASAAYSDASNDTSGPLLEDLAINTIARPGVCKLDPNHGVLNATVNYYGVKMDGSVSYFGNTYQKIAGVNSSFTNPKQGTAQVPNLADGKTSSFVLKGNIYSNYVDFNKDAEAYNGPYINSFEPAQGKEGQYVTIRGGGFGNSKGISKVYFGNAGGAEASYEFPDVCADSVWSNNQIIVKVPKGITNGNYQITVVVNGTTVNSSQASPSNFTVDNALPLAPSLCKMDPIIGQNNIGLNLWGEYFDAQDADSKVRFATNKDQAGAAISSWGIDTSVNTGIKPDKVTTTVHPQAITGPVKIVKGIVGLAGNGLNFTVGACQQDADCGGTSVCCAADSSEAGRCKATADECYVKVNACVYNWDFATGGSSSTSTVDTLEECSARADCCIDAQNNNAITWRPGDKNIVLGDNPDLAYCPYFSCDVNNATQCNSATSTTGVYTDLNSCQTDCANSIAPGTSCNTGTQAAPVCDTNLCSSSYSCLQNPGGEACGNCCCTPGTTNAKGLTCTADKGSCTGSSRGLFCGCSADSECGNLSSTGCGLDTCCRARPAVETVSPAENATDVCRNSIISATFSEQMDVGSFSSNVIVVGDYGIDTCPEGTEYLVNSDRPIAVRMADRIVAVLTKVPVLNRFLFGQELKAAVGNFCAITGVVSGYHGADGKTRMDFTPSKLLDGGRKYYVVIKGDKNLDGKNGVLNMNDIGMNPVNQESLNSITYRGRIWSFTTRSAQGANNGICTIDHVDVTPTSYLFNTTQNGLNENDNNPGDKTFDTANDSDKVFLAEAYDNKNQLLAPVPEYSWTWNWTTSKSTVADFINVAGLDGSRKLVRAKDGITDDKTTITATANASNGNYSDTAQAFVFSCKNPWPPVGTNGIWAPWKDGANGMNCLPGSGACSDTNYELYYCRDAGAEGTADDLPAILSNDTIIRGTSPVQLKEFYFLRESSPTTTASLIVGDQERGGEVFASWTPVPGANGYKLYYGPSAGRYNNFVDVGNATSKTVTGLSNDQTYYFTVTAYLGTGAESSYAGEVSVVPTDQTPPAMPTGFRLTPGQNSVNLAWNANTDDTIKYKVYYGVSHAIYGKAIDVGGATSTTVTGLNSTSTLYYFTVSALDKYGNESLKADELIVNMGDGGTTTMYKNALANVDFETGAIGGVPANWGRVQQSNSSMGITSAAAFSGSRSILIHQDPNEDFPGRCGQSLCQSLGGCSWIAGSSQCQFAGADTCKTVAPATYNANETLCWPNANRTMFASLYYDVSNLNWQVGKKYLIAFYYKGTNSGNIRIDFSYDPSWVGQCSSKIVPYINPDGSCKSNYGSTCSGQSNMCCVQAPIQTQCYTQITLSPITPGTHTGAYGGWNLYMATFDYTSAAAGWLDKLGNLHNRIGISIGYNNTQTTGSDLYIDNLIVAESL